jgi:hypothetical protein
MGPPRRAPVTPPGIAIKPRSRSILGGQLEIPLSRTAAGLVTGLTVGALMLGVGPAGPDFAKASPLGQERSSVSNGGSLVNGVSVLPGAIAGGAND